MGDETEMSVEPPNNNATTNDMLQDTESTPAAESTSIIIQELEYAPEEYIVQAIEDPTTEDPQPENGEVLNIEDHTSDIVHDINNTNDENAEAMAEIMTAEEIFDNCYGIRTSHYNLRPRKERNYLHIHTMIE